MALTRLQNIISSVEGRIIYVNPDDFDSTDAIDNKGNSPLRPFKTIARAVYEIARYSYVSAGTADDKFDQFTIMLYPGDHIVDNRPGSYLYKLDNANDIKVNLDEQFSSTAVIGEFGWSDSKKEYGELYKLTNSIRGGLIIPRGTSIIGLDLRKTKIRPKFIPGAVTDSSENFKNPVLNYDIEDFNNKTQLKVNSVSSGLASSSQGGSVTGLNDLYVGAVFEKGVQDAGGNNLIDPGTTITSINFDPDQQPNGTVNISKPHNYTSNLNSNTATLKYPYIDDNSRTALFKITGGCYFWQFSIFDGDTAGVFTSDIVIPKDNFAIVEASTLSHSKLTVFEYATLNDLDIFYKKVAYTDTTINTKFIETRVQENRIVGPLADTVEVSKVSRNDDVVTVQLSEELNLTSGNFVNIQGTISSTSSVNGIYTGEKKVAAVPNRSSFTFTLSATDTSTLNAGEGNVTEKEYASLSGVTVEVEIDTVESASPYIFNISMRSTLGMCGMHADGDKETGFKSMVVAQYTGISLQKLDSAFVKLNTNTGQYQAGGAGDTLHTDGDAIYSPLQRSFHVKASNRAVIQAVSVFAVGFADHFIAETGGDLSITNSNSNFGSNALRSIGFSDKAFTKDSLGKITHIIPPRNIESNETNYYWESFDTELTKNDPSKLYLFGRTNEVGIINGGTGFAGNNVQRNVFKDGVDTGFNVTTNASGGAITSITFGATAPGTLQPGDVLTIPADPGNVDCTFVYGDTLTTNVGEFKLGSKNLNTDGTPTNEVITVPLFANNTTLDQTNQTAVVNTTGNIFGYDNVNSNWFINVNSGATNQIHNVLSGAASSRYGSAGIQSTPSSFIKRTSDERVDNDKIYRLRYVTTSDSNNSPPSFPQTGYIIQPKKGPDTLGVGDRFTDGANLLLLNKEIIAREAILRYNIANSGSAVADIAECKDDLISIIETVAFDLRYGGTAKTVEGATLYTSGLGAFETQRSKTVEIINSVDNVNSSDPTYNPGLTNNFRGLRWMMENIINNGGGSRNGVTPTVKPYGNLSPGGTAPIYISADEEQLIYVEENPGGCANVISAADALLNIYVTAIGSDSNPGTVPSPTTFDPNFPNVNNRNVYNRISGYDYNDTYYVYDVEEVVPYDPTSDIGVYYLTVVKGSVSIPQSVLPGNTYRLSQNVDCLYPDIDKNNVVNDPIIARSVADSSVIGSVKVTEGTSNNSTTEDKSFSITKESVSCFLDEYLNNELQWIWDGKETTSTNVTNDVYPNSGGSVGATTTTLQSGNNVAETRRIPIQPADETVFYDVELRRPSTIRSGNHTFEYVGFGPGNYSTAFPIRQRKILSADEQKYSQSLKEAGGIAFYSGLNSNGDLYIGNTVINAVTGKTTENQISELDNLTVVNSFNVIGGSGNTITSNFQSPVNFSNDILGDGGDYVFPNIQLRNQSGFISKLTSSAGLPNYSGASEGDFAFNLNANNGNYVGHIRNQNEWRESGLIGVEKIHSYKDGSDYTLNVGSDWQNDLATQTAVNLNYDLDVTTNQRIGTHLDIGHGANDSIDSNTGTKQTKLQIKDNLSGSPTSTNTVELIKTGGSNPAHKFIRCADALNAELFSVDTAGNVSIPVDAEYGNAARAWSLTLTRKSSANAANNECTISLISPYYGADANGNIGPGGLSVPAFTGASELPQGQGLVTNSYLSGFVNKVDQTLDNFKFVGTPGNITQYFDNPNSILVFVNGVLQDPFLDYVITPTGDLIFSGVEPAIDDRIVIRGLAT